MAPHSLSVVLATAAASSLFIVALSSGNTHYVAAQAGTPSLATSSAPSKTTASAAAAGGNSCFSGYAATPLASKRFASPSNLPYKVTTDTNICRGEQVGYNICNSTTAGQTSLCQTSYVNSVDDFCLWGPREPNSSVADEEGEMVAWCTKPGKGTRLIPAGALTGVQFVKAPAYVQVVGFINQAMINIASNDGGGEMDPHGADGQGNPMGGVMFSSAFGKSGSSDFKQVVEWHNFMGSNMFCLKACDPSGSNAADYCQHIYDRIGCYYNAPASYSTINGTFESCASDNQMFPGVYVGDNGKTTTFTQPAESLGDISTMPYTAAIPKSSQCTTYTSSSLYLALLTVSNTAVPVLQTSSTPSATTGGTGMATSRLSGTTGVGAAGNAASPSTTSKPNSAAKGGVFTSAAIAAIALAAGFVVAA